MDEDTLYGVGRACFSAHDRSCNVCSLVQLDCLRWGDGLPVNTKPVLHAPWLCSPRQMMFVSDQLYWATSIVTIKHDQTTVILENLLPINVINSSAVCCTSWNNSRRRGDGHENMRIVEHIVAERLNYSVAMHLVYIGQRVVGICDLIDPSVDLLVGKVGDFQRLHLDCLSDVTIRGWVALRELLTRRRIHGEKEVAEKAKRKRKTDKRIRKTKEKSTKQRRKQKADGKRYVRNRLWERREEGVDWSS